MRKLFVIIGYICCTVATLTCASEPDFDPLPYISVPESGVKGRAIKYFHPVEFEILSEPGSKQLLGRFKNRSVYDSSGNQICGGGLKDIDGVQQYLPSCDKLFSLESNSNCDADFWIPYFEEKKVRDTLWYRIKFQQSDGWISQQQAPHVKALEQILIDESPHMLFTRQPFLINICTRPSTGCVPIIQQAKPVSHPYDLSEGKSNIKVDKIEVHLGEPYVQIEYDVYLSQDRSSTKGNRFRGRGYLKFLGNDGRPNIWKDTTCE